MSNNRELITSGTMQGKKPVTIAWGNVHLKCLLKKSKLLYLKYQLNNVYI